MNHHTHEWKPEVFRYQADYLSAMRTGNFICSCGEKLWEDEVLDILKIDNSFAIRGSGMTKKPILDVSRETWEKLTEKIIHHSEDWECDDEGDEYQVTRLDMEETSHNLEELVIDFLKGNLSKWMEKK